MVKRFIITSNNQTAEKIENVINNFSKDLNKLFLRIGNKNVPFSFLSLNLFFDYVSKINYKRDFPYKEIIARPKILLSTKKGLDCKKKTILICSWAKENLIKYRLVGSSSKKNKKIHHIYCELYINNRIIPVDATISKLGKRPFETNRINFTEWSG